MLTSDRAYYVNFADRPRNPRNPRRYWPTGAATITRRPARREPPTESGAKAENTPLRWAKGRGIQSQSAPRWGETSRARRAAGGSLFPRGPTHPGGRQNRGAPLGVRLRDTIVPRQSSLPRFVLTHQGRVGSQSGLVPSPLRPIPAYVKTAAQTATQPGCGRSPAPARWSGACRG